MNILVHYYLHLGYAVIWVDGVLGSQDASFLVIKDAIMSWLDAGLNVTIETF